MDLTIMGAGIFGLSCAWEAARRGAQVRVIDPGGIGAGASGGLVGALAPHAPETWKPAKELQLQALLGAADWWAAIEAAGGRPAGHGRTGRLQAIEDDRAVARAEERARNAETLWQGRAHWRIRPAQGGWEPASPTGLLVDDTLSGRISPRMALDSLAAAITASGGQIERRHAGDTPAEARAAGIDGPVIWCCGAAGLRAISRDLGRDIGRGEKGQALSLAVDGVADLPQIYAPGLHVIPHADGTVAIGSTSERDYTDPQATDEQLIALHRKAIEAMPRLADAPVVATWAGERPRAVTRTLVLGPWPEQPGHFIANGGFKTGFAMAPLAAGMMIDLVMDGLDRIPDALRLPQ